MRYFLICSLILLVVVSACCHKKPTDGTKPTTTCTGTNCPKK